MTHMKKTTYTQLVVAITVLACTLSVWAIPLGSNNDPADYLIKGRDLTRLSVGVYTFQADRNIVWDATGITETMDTRRLQAYLGVNILDWLTLYIIGGESESQIGSAASGDAEAEYGGGIQINFLNHFIREPVTAEDVIRLDFAAQFVASSSDNGSRSSDWNEASAALTVALVNHTEGNKFYSPESIAIYAGPIYSAIMGDDFDSDDSVGLTAGMEFFFTDTFTLDVQVQQFGETTMGAGLNFRF
jgi:hypothetical protein